MFGAPSVLILIVAGAPFTASLAAALIALYTVLSSAKVPFTLFASLLGALLTLRPQSRRLAIRAVTVGVFVFLSGLSILSASFQNEGLLSGLAEKLTRQTVQSNHLGDYVRARESRDEGSTLPLAHAADYVLYRVVFTPLEVSSRWYEYFHEHPLQQRRQVHHGP